MKKYQFRFVWYIGLRRYEGDWYNLSNYTLNDMSFNDEDMSGYNNWCLEYRWGE